MGNGVARAACLTNHDYLILERHAAPPNALCILPARDVLVLIQYRVLILFSRACLTKDGVSIGTFVCIFSGLDGKQRILALRFEHDAVLHKEKALYCLAPCGGVIPHTVSFEGRRASNCRGLEGLRPPYCYGRLFTV